MELEFPENIRMVIGIDDKGEATVFGVNGEKIEKINGEHNPPGIPEQPVLEKKNIYSIIPCTIMITNPCFYYWVGNYRYEYCY